MDLYIPYYLYLIYTKEKEPKLGSPKYKYVLKPNNIINNKLR